MMPMPPIQCSRCRHRLIDCGRSSRWLRIVEPVVVSPDIASKYASVKLRSGRAIMSGIAAEPDISTQDNVTSRNPSRGFSSRRKRRVAPASVRPTNALMRPAATKSSTAPSCTPSDQAIGNR